MAFRAAAFLRTAPSRFLGAAAALCTTLRGETILRGEEGAGLERRGLAGRASETEEAAATGLASAAEYLDKMLQNYTGGGAARTNERGDVQCRQFPATASAP